MYDGGVGGVCGGGGHGGYTYCGVGALALCGHRDHAHAVAEYACRRQMAVEGGFQGRTNKLVDTCYSYWQGALLPVLAEMGADVYGVRWCGHVRRSAWALLSQRRVRKKRIEKKLIDAI